MEVLFQACSEPGEWIQLRDHLLTVSRIAFPAQILVGASGMDELRLMNFVLAVYSSSFLLAVFTPAAAFSTRQAQFVAILCDTCDEERTRWLSIDADKAPFIKQQPWFPRSVQLHQQHLSPCHQVHTRCGLRKSNLLLRLKAQQLVQCSHASPAHA